MAKKEFLSWLTKDEIDALNVQPEIASRNSHAKKIKELSIEKIISENTNLQPKEMQSFIDEVCEQLTFTLNGVGVELGAGSAGLSASFLKNQNHDIDVIYGVEIVPGVVEHLQTKVAKKSGLEGRLVPVLGSFDDIKLEDNSVDFMIELDSLHHSNDLVRTLKEVYRTLKPGGKLIAFDRVQFNSLSKSQQTYMLDKVYPVSFLEQYDLPRDMVLTRRENGEHEISEDEWRASIREAGLQVEYLKHFHRKSLKNFIYILISQIPFSIRRMLNKYPMLVRYPLSALLFYIAPFLKFTSFRAFKTRFDYRGAFLQKTVLVISKPANQ